jgi:alpha-L-fucosidase
MPNGLIHKNDEKAALELAKAIKEAFAVNLAKKVKAEASNVRGNSAKFGADQALDGDKETYWATDDNINSASLTIRFDKPTTFNRFLVQEYIRLGQRVKSFTVEAYVKGEWKELAKETTIGYKRILCFPTVEATKFRFTITDSKSCPLISNIEIYNAPQILTAPTIIREQLGEVSIIPADAESQIYYTLDGNSPTLKSTKYAGKIKTKEGKITVKAIAYNPATGKSSALTEEKFDIARKNWKILDSNDAEAYKITDGNSSSVWHQDKNKKMPVDLVIDLGKVEKLIGFRYLPDQNLRSKGIITNYEFYTSQDNKTWKLIHQGEFSNINNNPLWQTKSFELTKAKFIKLTALKNTKNDDFVGYAEIDVITE